jgi:hypothetical protein
MADKSPETRTCASGMDGVYLRGRSRSPAGWGMVQQFDRTRGGSMSYKYDYKEKDDKCKKYKKDKDKHEKKDKWCKPRRKKKWCKKR